MFLCAADQSVRYIIPYGGSAFFIIQEVPMYQVLYRKYRPRVFADVYGQDHVTSTLKNEIKEGRISHAYLFTGSRGTGKTTCAKILAKAVNCPNAVDGEPCNACEICKGLDSGTIYDVVEIDAASNNGVDNIRDLREEVNYTPTRGKYRVYIIDEVHMLSTGAFNALLKTLEEPPAHVIFILATTEVHKLPATILSRCQRFDFKRIQPETMAVRLQQVAGLEGTGCCHPDRPHCRRCPARRPVHFGSMRRAQQADYCPAGQRSGRFGRARGTLSPVGRRTGPGQQRRCGGAGSAP